MGICRLFRNCHIHRVVDVFISPLSEKISIWSMIQISIPRITFVCFKDFHCFSILFFSPSLLALSLVAAVKNSLLVLAMHSKWIKRQHHQPIYSRSSPIEALWRIFLMALFWYGIYFIQIARLCMGDEVKWRREERFDKVRWQKKRKKENKHGARHTQIFDERRIVKRCPASERERENEKEHKQSKA